MMRSFALAAGLSLSVLALSIGGSGTAIAAPAFPTPLPEETLPSVAKLPAQWPASWVLIHDFRFMSIVDGRIAVVDTADPVRPLKGLVRAAQFANMLVSPDRGEIYTAETFYTRLSRGERTDAITIWDMATLEPKGEIVLPGGKRQQSVTYPHLFQFTNGGKWALIANFTPAQSVTVVDLAARKILNEIDLPGCAQIYPTGERGFTSLCADGSAFSVTLDEKGAAASSKTVLKVQDIDRQPLFGTPAIVGKTAWFVSFYGMIQGFDLSGTVIRPLPGSFSVGSAEGGQPEWRPGGWEVIHADAAGRLYVLMSPYGKEGSHKDGGTEVWVVDPVKKARVQRIALKGQSVAIAVTREEQPHVVAARADGVVDVYDAGTGAFVRTLGANVGANPIMITVPR
ncbi:amine dehydrogenase large subunit [Novosphingobium sp. SG720]|uniref:amine dehydrogenase large subunit n=1 Tax=Novosphingobium sp. SG720 TaxID=2586998 RepID=UPI0017F534DB|nr:amine dehydrogenase large subunit [Novosphingobium sp. SG720]NKJ44110.1 methylamine dehydrogenase heavy chain [Novosphingobium sp. SG720]